MVSNRNIRNIECFVFLYRITIPSTSNIQENVMQNINLTPTSEEITDNLIPASKSGQIIKRDATDDGSNHASTKAETESVKAPAPSPTPDKREDLTALKALDVLLRKYDRRSTPTNDLGNIELNKYSIIETIML